MNPEDGKLVLGRLLKACEKADTTQINSAVNMNEWKVDEVLFSNR